MAETYPADDFVDVFFVWAWYHLFSRRIPAWIFLLISINELGHNMYVNAIFSYCTCGATIMLGSGFGSNVVRVHTPVSTGLRWSYTSVYNELFPYGQPTTTLNLFKASPQCFISCSGVRISSSGQCWTVVLWPATFSVIRGCTLLVRRARTILRRWIRLIINVSRQAPASVSQSWRTLAEQSRGPYDRFDAPCGRAFRVKCSTRRSGGPEISGQDNTPSFWDTIARHQCLFLKVSLFLFCLYNYVND